MAASQNATPGSFDFLMRAGDHAAAAARRQAVNTVPQGSAADLVKLVMIQLAQQLPERFPNKGCRLLLQVHPHSCQFMSISTKHYVWIADPAVNSVHHISLSHTSEETIAQVHAIGLSLGRANLFLSWFLPGKAPGHTLWLGSWIFGCNTSHLVQ